MSWVQESRGWPSWLAPEVLPDARGGWRADGATAGTAFTRTKAQSPGLSPAGDADGKAKREAANGDRSTGTSGTEGGRRGGRSSVTAGQARQMPAREPIRHFCQRKKARPEQRKDLRGTQGRRRPGGRHCGNISFRWGSLPKERASLRNTRAGDSVWWPQRKANDEVTVHCLTSTGIASPRATRATLSRGKESAEWGPGPGKELVPLSPTVRIITKRKTQILSVFFFLSRK